MRKEHWLPGGSENRRRDGEFRRRYERPYFLIGQEDMCDPMLLQVQGYYEIEELKSILKYYTIYMYNMP